MNTINIIELVSIGLTAVVGQIGVYAMVWYFYKRNIFTQKILFLNQKLKSLEGKSLVSFRIGRYVKFQPSLSFESSYPPSINRNYLLNNSQYKKVKDDFYRLCHDLKRLARILTLCYLFGIIFLGIIYLIYHS